MKRLIPSAMALLLLLALHAVATASVRVPDSKSVSGLYSFKQHDIAMPPNYQNVPKLTLRTVNPEYFKIRSWISSVGASIAMNDLVGNGREDALCLVDTRTDQVIVTYTPTAAPADRFTPFVLSGKPLPMSPTMAPMGCAFGDFNSDGEMDVLVYYWGRTPIIFQAKGTPGPLSEAAFEPLEVVPSSPSNGAYTGQQWNTNAILINDLNGDGRPDLIVGNYFPESGVLDPNGRNDVHMNDSLSRATNAGGVRVLRWAGSTPGNRPLYVEDKHAVPFSESTGWTLALASGDLTDDQLPEVYVANDFGHDHLLYNESTLSQIRFRTATGSRGITTPKSFVLGQGSFKGMGVDFVDLSNRAKFDMVVSNITSPLGLQESNFVWQNDAPDPESMKRSLEAGNAPFTQVAQERGLAWTGWCWDVKAGDFLNSGTNDIVQSNGFVKGRHNRWAWLQELATTNDVLIKEPGMWPNLQPGDDVSGHQRLAFYAHTPSGKYTNITRDIRTDIPTPSRGVAIGDSTGSGRLDFAVAYQWDAPVFYENTSPDLGHYLEFNLTRPGVAPGTETPAYGAVVQIRRPDGVGSLGQLDGGSGHGGKRGFAVHFGLGASDGPVEATIKWRDSSGQSHVQTTTVSPGSHSFSLTDTLKELPR